MTEDSRAKTHNKVFSLLCDLGVCDERSVESLYPRVRDRDDISVFRCRRSGVIFLSRSDLMDESHYQDVEGFGYWGASERRQAVLSALEDDQRRADQFQSIVRDKRWLDVGTGAGGILDLLGPLASEPSDVEPRAAVREVLLKCGHKVFANLQEALDDHFEVVTLSLPT